MRIEFQRANLPEDKARQRIVALQEAVGTVIQDLNELVRNTSVGVAGREFPLPTVSCHK